jgi:hypothetical protein
LANHREVRLLVNPGKLSVAALTAGVIPGKASQFTVPWSFSLVGQPKNQPDQPKSVEVMGGRAGQAAGSAEESAGSAEEGHPGGGHPDESNKACARAASPIGPYLAGTQAEFPRGELWRGLVKSRPMTCQKGLVFPHLTGDFDSFERFWIHSNVLGPPSP